MSEYSLVVKYSLVGRHTLILYDSINRRYAETGNSSFISIFLLLSIWKNIKKVYKDLWYQKDRTDYHTQIVKTK